MIKRRIDYSIKGFSIGNFIFVTTSTFRKTARDYAKVTGLELVDDYDLLNIIEYGKPDLLYKDYIPENEAI